MRYYMDKNDKSGVWTTIKNSDGELVYYIAGHIGRPNSTLYLYASNHTRIASLTEGDTRHHFNLITQSNDYYLKRYGQYHYHFFVINALMWGWSNLQKQSGILFHRAHPTLRIQRDNQNIPGIYQIELDEDHPEFLLVGMVMFDTPYIRSSKKLFVQYFTRNNRCLD